jgi:hypothetical protein
LGHGVDLRLEPGIGASVTRPYGDGEKRSELKR